MEVIDFSSEQDFIITSVEFINNICAIKTPVSIALSGGSTPIQIYEAMAQSADVDWSKINFFQVDERCVPADHPDSNYRMIREALSRDIIHFDTNLSIDECLAAYEQRLPPSFDLCVLGMGPDGHTASLFPRSSALHETTRLVAHTTTDAFPVRDRLTLTFPAIMRSKKLLLLVKGENKKQILDDLLHSSKTIDELPAKKLLEHPGITIHYFSEARPL